MSITFDDLVAHFGEFLAWKYLEEIEKASGIQSRDADGDPETRLARACQLQDSHARS